MGQEGGGVEGRASSARTAARDRRRDRSARRMRTGRSRAYVVAVWGLWAVTCLLIGLAGSLVCWMGAALLHWSPSAAPLAWPVVSILTFAAAAPHIRAQLNRGGAEKQATLYDLKTEGSR